mgnify:CR=1 FL=1
MLKKRRNPYLAVDAVIIDPSPKKLVLIKRKKDPFKDHWALPGGFVEWGETTENACLREVYEETGLRIKIIDLVGVFSDPKRDPRGHVVSVAYLCLPLTRDLRASSDAKHADWISISEILKGNIRLAFDHYDIIRKAVDKAYSLGVIK